MSDKTTSFDNPAKGSNNAELGLKPDTSGGHSVSFTLAFSALFLGAIAMGSSPVFVRYAEIGPFASAFWRVTLALPPLLIWYWLETRERGTFRAELFQMNGAVLLTGIFFAGDLFFWHLSILHTTIANAALMACLAPVWVILLSGIFIGEKVEARAYLGLILCLAGAALLIGSSFAIAPERLVGDLYGVVTSLFFGLYFLSLRVARRTQGAAGVTLKSAFVTALVLFIITLISGQNFWPHSLVGVSALLALGFFSHLGGQGLLAVALGSLSATFSSLVIFIEALAAAILGWLIFSEELTLLQCAGGGLILIGIWVARPQD